jgi:hypothetical protein
MSAITFHRGRTASMITQITDQDGTPRNLAGALVYLRIKDENGPADESHLTLGVTAGITVDNEATGEISVKMTPAQTAGFAAGSYAYELYVRFPDGEVSTAEIGVFKFRTPPADTLL